ncbi:hypothetical protein JCM3765_006936 [Sporobolomyces pararoseus]
MDWLPARISAKESHSFFLQSLEEPHLTLASSLSYYEGAETRPHFQQRTQSALTSHYALTPHPHPSTSNSTPTTADPTDRESLLVSTKTFEDQGDGDVGDEKESKVWVGRTKEGNWVGVWQFDSALPFVQTSFHTPKLAMTITVSFRDDPKLDKVLSIQNSKPDINGTKEDAELERAKEEEEEYMDDSYDDVNLLSSLGTSHSFHLPFSRLPSSFLPPLSTAPPTSHTRRHSRTHSLDSAPPDSTLASGSAPPPLLRRSILRTFELRKPLQVSIRTIHCSIPDSSTIATREGGQEATGGGMVVLLELVGPAEMGEMFEIEEIQVKAGSTKSGISILSGNISSDIEVRRVASASPGPEVKDSKIRLGANDQHNFAYKLAPSPSSQLLEQQQQSLPILTATSGHGEGLSSVPIGVATSPSQRFTARFGSAEEDGTTDEYEEDEMDRRREREQERDRKQREGTYRRNLEVVVRGKVLVKMNRKVELEGYTVEEEATAKRREEEEEWISPTREISSKRDYTIDISSFAHRPPPLQAQFGPVTSISPTPRLHLRPTSIAAPQIPLLLPSALQPSSASAAKTTIADRSEIESIAGSKRHTMASLASLSLKSPVLGRKASLAPLPTLQTSNSRPPPQRYSSNMISPMPPPLATPGATGGAGPRRFFSLPPASQESIATSTSATPTTSQLFTNRRQTETPPPMVTDPISPAVARNSLPLPNQNAEGKRTSWMSGLGIGKSGSAAAGSSEGVTSWDTVGSGVRTNRESAGLGLGLDATGTDSLRPPLPARSTLPLRPSEIDNPEFYQYSQPVKNGRILVTLSLVPLRTVKSRRNLHDLASHAEAEIPSDLPPATLPGLTTTLSPPATHHASFNFPPSSPTSPTSSSPGGSPNPNSVQTSNSFSEAERTALLTSRMPRVGLLDVFLVQLFIVNQTDQVKRFIVGVPPRRKDTISTPHQVSGRPRGQQLGVRPQNGSAKVQAEEFATLVPLENDVRIGPLAPNSCASLGLRMLAISPGAHVLEELKLVDQEDGSETTLRRPLWVVVE